MDKLKTDWRKILVSRIRFNRALSRLRDARASQPAAGVFVLTSTLRVFAFADANLDAAMDESIAATHKMKGGDDCAFKAVVY